MAIDTVVLNNDHPDYQHYVDTDPKLAEFVGEADVKMDVSGTFRHQQ